MQALVLTPTALFRLSNYSITPEWFSEFGLPRDAIGLKRVVIDDIIFILETALESDAVPIVVINIDREHGIFSDRGTLANVFERVITVARFRLYGQRFHSHWLAPASRRQPHLDPGTIAGEELARPASFRDSPEWKG